MNYIDESKIVALNISPLTCIQWVTEAFCIKKNCQLPAKISVHPTGNDFITTMPCLLPKSFQSFGLKVVSRKNGRHPSLKSNIMLFDSQTGNITTVMDSDWITSMRTGAVAALAVKTFRKNNTKIYAFIGLGNTARATMKCLSEQFKNELLTVKLFRYKKQAEMFEEEFSTHKHIRFEIVDSIQELLENTDVLISCVTDAHGLIVEDTNLFKPGILVLPIHTRGFQNCDLFFDKVFADDTDHVKGFKYFDKFKCFNEICEVLTNNTPGRTSDSERIISYNIGLGLHDVYFANKILSLL